MDKLRVAVAGVGSFGQHHARICGESTQTELVAVVDPREERGREIAERVCTRWVPSLQEVLSDVDAVEVVVPTKIHHEIGLMVLEAGKHLLMEKPMAWTLEEGKSLLSALAKAREQKPGLVAGVGHLERFNPAVKALRQQGFKPRFIETTRVSPFPMRNLETDVVLEVMIHDLDLLLALMGTTVTDVEAVGIPVLSKCADIVNARLKFAGGGFATAVASRVARKKERTLRAFGENAYASLDFAAQKLELLRLVSGPEGPQVQPELVDVTEAEPLKLEMESFYAACLGKGQDVVSWTEAYEAMRVADLIQKAVEESLQSMQA